LRQSIGPKHKGFQRFQDQQNEQACLTHICAQSLEHKTRSIIALETSAKHLSKNAAPFTQTLWLIKIKPKLSDAVLA
jgi:hypothetical protein